MIFLCLVGVQVWLSEGFSMETAMIQWGYWRFMWRRGCRVGKGRSHTHALFPPGSHAEWDRSCACIWGAAPGRHTDELMKCYAVLLDETGVWRVWWEGVIAINHPGRSWVLPYQPDKGEVHGAKATWKALSVPLSVTGQGWSQRRKAEGITTRRCGAK